MNTIPAERLLAASAGFAIRTLSELKGFYSFFLFFFFLFSFFAYILQGRGCSVGSGKSHIRGSVLAGRGGSEKSGEMILWETI